VQPAGWWLVQNRNNGIWTTQVIPAGRDELYLDNFKGDQIVLRAVDRLGNLSEPAVWMNANGR
jgi:hypothetical protein